MRQLQRVSIAGLVAICLLGAPSSRAAIGAQPVVATSWPAAFVFDPGGRIFYGNRFTGQIRIFDPATGGDTLFFALPDVATVGEQGLLGLALHPSYPVKPYVFAYYTRTVGGKPENQIVQLTDSTGTGGGFHTLLPLPRPGRASARCSRSPRPETTTEASSTSGPTTTSTRSSATSAIAPMRRISPRSQAKCCEFGNPRSADAQPFGVQP